MARNPSVKTATGDAAKAPGRVWRERRRLAAVCALAVIAAVAVSACGSSGGSPSASNSGQAATSGLYGTLPPVGTPTHGGTLTIGQLTGSTPTAIFPIIPGADTTAYTDSFVTELYAPLYAGPVGATPEVDYALSVANPPSFSDGDTVVTIPLKQGWKWSNGEPVDANDLIFEIDLLKAAVTENAANWGQYTPGEFPTSVVSATAKNQYTVVLKLDKAYNPGFFLNNQVADTDNVFPLPSTAWNIDAAGGPHLDYTNPANAKKIYDYLSKIGTSLSSFATNPLWQDVDGPFKLKSFNTTNSSYDLVPNPSYGGTPKPYVSEVDTETYTGITPQLNALKTGALDISGIDFSQLAQAPALKALGISVYGYPSFGWFGAIINFKDTTGHFNDIISQLYIRQALAELEDEPAYIQGIFKGAGGPSYGPVPALPKTPYTPPDAIHTPYPYNPSAAVALLKAHGWKVVPGGQTTCQNAGSGSNQCGAGIPAGTPFAFSWYYIPASETPSSSLESEAFASEARAAAGIDISLVSKTFNYMIENFNDADPADAKYENQWGISNYGGELYDYYPTSDGIFNAGGELNSGDYTDPTAARLIHDSVYSGNPDAVINEASYLVKDIPVLFMPNSDELLGIAKGVGGAADGFMALTQLQTLPQYFYLTK
jgi:peptide/nickel transport system substrate-binding protein